MGTKMTINGEAIMGGEINTNYGVACKRLIFRHVVDLGLDVGDSVGANIITPSGNTRMFSGTIKSVVRRRPDGSWEFTCEDVLAKAIEYWFTPSDLDVGWTRRNINHLDLTKDILKEATIPNLDVIDDWTPTGYPTFQFAVGPEPVKITVASAWDTIGWICAITGMHVYADVSSKVHMTRIWDEPGPIVHAYMSTGNAGNMKTLEYTRSDENLRNKVVVYGRDNLYKVASGSSPYVPAGFWKTAIVSSTMIEGDAMAQEVADINLLRMNKLTEACIVDCIGNTSLDCRQTVNITDPKIGVSGNWFVSQIQHKVDPNSGYTCRLTCNK
jgi:hypothetical protein